MCYKANPSDYHQQVATATSGIMLWHQYEITLFFLLSCFRIIPWVLFRLNFVLVDQQWFKHEGIFKATMLAVLIIWNVSISLPGFLGNGHVRVWTLTIWLLLDCLLFLLFFVIELAITVCSNIHIRNCLVSFVLSVCSGYSQVDLWFPCS